MKRSETPVLLLVLAPLLALIGKLVLVRFVLAPVLVSAVAFGEVVLSPVLAPLLALGELVLVHVLWHLRILQKHDGQNQGISSGKTATSPIVVREPIPPVVYALLWRVLCSWSSEATRQSVPVVRHSLLWRVPCSWSLGVSDLLKQPSENLQIVYGKPIVTWFCEISGLRFTPIPMFCTILASCWHCILSSSFNTGAISKLFITLVFGENDLTVGCENFLSQHTGLAPK